MSDLLVPIVDSPYSSEVVMSDPSTFPQKLRNAASAQFLIIKDKREADGMSALLRDTADYVEALEEDVVDGGAIESLTKCYAAAKVTIDRFRKQLGENEERIAKLEATSKASLWR